MPISKPPSFAFDVVARVGGGRGMRWRGRRREQAAWERAVD